MLLITSNYSCHPATLATLTAPAPTPAAPSAPSVAATTAGGRALWHVPDCSSTAGASVTWHEMMAELAAGLTFLMFQSLMASHGLMIW